jgi:MFS transporter, PHS family, inorganic phosphate transporter
VEDFFIRPEVGNRTSLRARMLAAVFFMQPVGQLLANVVAIIATALSHRYISQDSDPANCIRDCMETTDKIWRWIVGLGAVPPRTTN